MRDILGTFLIGVFLGGALSWIGFSSWDEVHRMFTFTDPSFRLLLSFALAVVLLSIFFQVLKKRSDMVFATRTIHKGTILGGLLFGTGWAITGVCPSMSLVQLGEGQLGAAFTILGIFIGNWIFAVIQERWLHWQVGSCGD